MAAGDGLVTMTPTSIVHSGTSASINADGGVDFTAVTSLSLNGVFTSGFDNYLISVKCVADSGTPYAILRLRAAGSDATGSNYTSQYLLANSTTVGGARATTTGGIIAYVETRINGCVVHTYGPYLAQPTAFRSVTALDFNNAYIEDRAITHSLSTSYDGITLYPGSSSITGNIVVFGYEE